MRNGKPEVCMDWILDLDACCLQQEQEYGFLCCSLSGFCIC